MLHPQVRALLDQLERSGSPAVHTLGVPEARATAARRRALTQPPPPEVARSTDLQASGSAGPIPLRLYRPLGAPQAALLPVLVYFHGGGFVLGDLDSHDTLCRQLANFSGCAVVAVGYRLAPEHPFPAAVLDSIAATRWVHAHAADLRLDASRLAIGGDSAGGTLAAAVAIAARDGGDLPIAFQLLIYPAIDVRCRTRSQQENAQGYYLTRDSINYFSGHYLSSPSDYDDWRASVILQPDLSRLPRSLVLTAGFDPLRDEGAEYAQRLTAAGSPGSYVCFSRQIHGFVPMGRLLDEATTAVALCATELRRALWEPA